MAQQTAVEWLVEKLEINPGIRKWVADAIKKAKQMEKEQIKEAWLNGDNDSMYEPKQLEEQAEEYYKERYCEYSGLPSVKSYEDPKK